MKNILFTIIVLISFVSFGQLNELKLGNNLKFKKNNIEFSFKEPLSFEQTSQSYSSDNSNIIVSFLNRQNKILIEAYSTPIPEKFYSDADVFFSNKEKLENLMNQMLPKPLNKIISYKIIKIGYQSFLEVSLISNNIQKQTNWITLYKNNLINIYGTTTTSNFSNIESFLSKFKKSIRIN